MCTYSRTTRIHGSKTNYSISGVKTTLRRALIRACVPTYAVATEDPRGCSNTRVSGRRARTRAFPVRLLPSDPCYCCDLMKCYARSPAITFPLHRLTPHSVGLVSRSGTSFLPGDPWGYGFHPRLLYRVERYINIVRYESLIDSFLRSRFEYP